KDMASSGIWTKDIARRFYGNVNQLSSKLKGEKSPRKPVDYRLNPRERRDSREYLLPYEEELHLADHFASLAHVSESVECVSAATIEETNDPPAFTIRLASNETPQPHVVEGLEKILTIVREHAEAGKDREEYKARLFDEVVSFSQERIYGRMRTSQWKRPLHHRRSNHLPLHERLEQNLAGIWAQSGNKSPQITSLRRALFALRDALKGVHNGTPENQHSLLKTAILACHAVSNHDGSASLETHLQRLGLPERISHSREVAEIDKLSKYWQVCNHLIRLSRQPQSRAHCQNFALDICTAYPPLQPAGAVGACHVHAEVQLVLFYEQTSPLRVEKLPRAMGASKSACFLCDLFLAQHGRFGLSSSHMKLYPKWSIAEAPWTSAAHVRKFRGIVGAMSAEIGQLLRRGVFLRNVFAESRAHVLGIAQSEATASSVISSVLSSASSTTIIPTPYTTTHIYRLADLPITLDMFPSSTGCELTAGVITYFFDFCDVTTAGKLCISSTTPEGRRGERINAMELGKDETCVRAGVGERELAFYLHGDGRDEVWVSVSWDDP
ncbi:hypothetical protein LSUE1_G008739, partial [Lachnellula suecica]